MESFRDVLFMQCYLEQQQEMIINSLRDRNRTPESLNPVNDKNFSRHPVSSSINKSTINKERILSTYNQWLCQNQDHI